MSDVQKAKNLLMAAYYGRRELALLAEKRKTYLEMATQITAAMDGMPHNHSGKSAVESAAISLKTLDDVVSQKAESASKAMADAEKYIGKLEKLRHREVLTYRYICGQSWGEVAASMAYADVKSAFRVHGRALAALAEKMAEKMED